MFLEALGAQIEHLHPEATIERATSLDGILRHAQQGDDFALVLVDFHMPGIAGIEGVRKAIAAFPRAIVAVISGAATTADIHSAIQAGASGFLPKTLALDQFAAAINALLTGTTYVPADVVRDLLAGPAGGDAATAASVPGDSAFATLSQREREVLRGLTEGMSNKEIARHLSLAEVTVKLHVRQIFKKIGARSRTEAVALAMRAGVMEP
jgi:two-component system nitrate/nitrite response regulator NarL